MEDFTVNTVETDYRAETLVAGLMENGADVSNTLIIREKGDMRGVAKDIRKIEKQYAASGFDLVEYLCVYTHRDGIYDALPEGIFHQTAGTRKQKSKEEILHEIKTYREEEFFARKYFQPFEMILDKALADALVHEQRYHRPHLYNHLSDIVGEYWELLKLLSLRQALLFIKNIPVLEEVSRSLELTAKLTGIILDCPVSICEGNKSVHCMDAKEIVPLGKWKLGINSVIGKTLKSDYPDLEITIGPVSPEKMRLFLAGKTNDRILKSLIDIMIPFDRNTTLKYRITESEKKFRLSDDTHKAWLGINTTI
jgi:hypothetical protein